MIVASPGAFPEMDAAASFEEYLVTVAIALLLDVQVRPVISPALYSVLSSFIRVTPRELPTLMKWRLEVELSCL